MHYWNKCICILIIQEQYFTELLSFACILASWTCKICSWTALGVMCLDHSITSLSHQLHWMLIVKAWIGLSAIVLKTQDNVHPSFISWGFRSGFYSVWSPGLRVQPDLAEVLWFAQEKHRDDTSAGDWRLSLQLFWFDSSLAWGCVSSKLCMHVLISSMLRINAL